MRHRRSLRILLVIMCALGAVAAIAAVEQTQGNAKVDLMTASGVGQFKAQWRYSDATIVNVTSAATDKTIAEWTEAQMKGGGGYRPTPPAPPRMTYDIQPKAGGWNTTMRVPLTTAVKPGEAIQVAVFAINGPISDTPTNRLFIRSAAVEFAQ